MSAYRPRTAHDRDRSAGDRSGGWLHGDAAGAPAAGVGPGLATAGAHGRGGGGRADLHRPFKHAGASRRAGRGEADPESRVPDSADRAVRGGLPRRPSDQAGGHATVRSRRARGCGRRGVRGASRRRSNCYKVKGIWR